MLLLSVLILSLAIGTLRGGRLGALGEYRWRFPFLPFLALGVQVIAFLPDESASGSARTFAAFLHVLSYLLLLAFVFANRRTPWMWLMGLGLALNAVAIVANGGFMPASPYALLGTPSADVSLRGYYNNSVVMSRGTQLWFLGDVLRTPDWLLLRRAFSVGDLAIATGTFALVQHLMRRRGGTDRGGLG